jgi:hypothetical protein
LQGGGYCAELVTQAAGPRGAVCSTAEQAQRTPISVTVPFSDPIRPDSPVTVSGHVASATARLVELVYPDGGSDRVELGERGFYVAEVPPAHLAGPSTSMVWAVSHDRGTLLRVDPRSGRVVRRITLSSDPHGVAFGSGLVWVALYHESTIVRVDPRTSRISGPPTRAGFPTEPMAAAGGYLWAIPSVGGHLADHSCTPCWRSTPAAAASCAPTAPAAARAMSWRQATPSGWRRPSRTSWSASPAQPRGSPRLRRHARVVADPC